MKHCSLKQPDNYFYYGGEPIRERCTMTLKYNLTLRGFLSHIQAMARKRACLVGEYVLSPFNPERKSPDISDDFEVIWNSLHSDLKKVLGVDLCPYSKLISDCTFDLNAGWERGCKDPYRIRMGVLKARVDKARLKDPSITLLKSVVMEEEEC